MVVEILLDVDGQQRPTSFIYSVSLCAGLRVGGTIMLGRNTELHELASVHVLVLKPLVALLRKPS